ncbi:MAG: hypothetical protein ACM3YE_17375, partial [Bacteroidota bacterium]
MRISVVMRLLIVIIMIMLIFSNVIIVAGATNSSPLDEANNSETETEYLVKEELVKGKVIEVISEEEVIDPLSQQPTKHQILKVRVTSGKYKGKELAVINYQTDNPIFNIKVAQGNRVIIALEIDETEDKIQQAYIADHLREDELYLLLILFLIVILAIGWRKGAK